jgi:hypothetical protein
MAAARTAVDLVLAAHMPFPAQAIDRRWTPVACNDAVGALTAGVAAESLEPPVNVLRLSLLPQGLAPRIDNLGEWRTHLLACLQQPIDRSGDAELVALHREPSAYASRASAMLHHDLAPVAVSLRLRMGGVAEPLSFISTTTVFGTPIDDTLSELALECLFPATTGRARRYKRRVRTLPDVTQHLVAA